MRTFVYTRILTGSIRNDCRHFEAMYRTQFSMHFLGSYRKLKPKDTQIDWYNHMFGAAIFGAKFQMSANNKNQNETFFDDFESLWDGIYNFWKLCPIQSYHLAWDTINNQIHKKMSHSYFYSLARYCSKHLNFRAKKWQHQKCDSTNRFVHPLALICDMNQDPVYALVRLFVRSLRFIIRIPW